MPNSSSSTRSGAIAAALSTTNGPSLLLVQDARSELLAAAGGAADQDAAVGGSDAVELGFQLVDGSGVADHLEAHHRALLERPHLALQPGGLQRALRHQQQAVGLERLLDVVVGAALDGRHRGLDVAVAGDDDHRQLGMRLLGDVENLEPVQPAALQPDVENDELRAALLDRLQRLVRIAGDARAVAVVLKEASHHLADVGLVIDDQDVRGHRLSLLALWTIRHDRRRQRRTVRVSTPVPSRAQGRDGPEG
jgi:hypothetical protein